MAVDPLGGSAVVVAGIALVGQLVTARNDRIAKRSATKLEERTAERTSFRDDFDTVVDGLRAELARVSARLDEESTKREAAEAKAEAAALHAERTDRDLRAQRRRTTQLERAMHDAGITVPPALEG